jgi:hypothetical protein
MIAGSPLFESILESIPLGNIVLLHSEHPTSRSNAETLREVHRLAQCPRTGRHTPTFSRQRGTLLWATARFGRSSVSNNRKPNFREWYLSEARLPKRTLLGFSVNKEP